MLGRWFESGPGSQFSQSLSQQRDPPLRAIAGELVELSEELEVEAFTPY